MKKIIGYIFSFIVFISMYGGAMLFCGYQKELIIDPIIVDIVVSITIILTTIITLLTMSIGAVLLLFIRVPMARIFLNDDVESIKVCSEYLVFLLLGLPAFGLFQVFTGLFQGSGRTELSLLTSALRLWGFRLPFTFLLLYVGKLGAPSVWYAMVLSNTAISIVCIFLYRFIDYKPRVSNTKKRLEKVMNLN